MSKHRRVALSSVKDQPRNGRRFRNPGFFFAETRFGHHLSQNSIKTRRNRIRSLVCTFMTELT